MSEKWRRWKRCELLRDFLVISLDVNIFASKDLQMTCAISTTFPSLPINFTTYPAVLTLILTAIKHGPCVSPYYNLHLHLTNLHLHHPTIYTPDSKMSDPPRSRFAPSRGFGYPRGRSCVGDRSELDFDITLLNRVLYDEDIMCGRTTEPADAAHLDSDMQLAYMLKTEARGGRGRGRAGVNIPPASGFGRQTTSSITGYTPQTFDGYREFSPVTATSKPTDSTENARIPVQGRRFAKLLASRNGGKPMPTNECSCKFCFGYEAYLAVSHRPKSLSHEYTKWCDRV